MRLYLVGGAVVLCLAAASNLAFFEADIFEFEDHHYERHHRH